MRTGRRLPFALLSLLLLLVSSHPRAQLGPPPELVDAVWVVGSGDLIKVSAADGATLLQIPSASGAEAVAVDEIGQRTWVWNGDTLLGFDFTGTLQATTSVSGVGGGSSVLRLAAHDGVLWLGSDDQLLRFDPAAQLLGTTQLAAPLTDLAVDRSAGTLRVATATRVFTFDATGAQTGVLDLGAGDDIVSIDVDRGSRSLWVATGTGLQRFSAEGALLTTHAVSGVGSVAADGARGVWAVTSRDVLRIDGEGVRVVDLPRFAEKGGIQALAGAGRDGSAWVGTQQILSRIGPSGQVLLSLTLTSGQLTGRTSDVAIYEDLIPPAIELVRPAPGQVFDTVFPTFELAYGDIGQGVDVSTLQVVLGGAPVAVICDAGPASATCALEEAIFDGSYTLTASLEDFAGNLGSAQVVFQVQLPPFNRPPALDPVGDLSVDLGDNLTVDLTAVDPDGDPVSFAVSPLPLPAGASFDTGTGRFRFAPQAVSTFNLTFSATDGEDSSSETVTVTVVGPAAGTPTGLAGRVLDTADFLAGVETPVVGATVTILGSGVSTVTGSDGSFLLSGVPGGSQVFDIDATMAAPAPDGSPYASFREEIELIDGVVNNESRPFFLPRIAAESLTTVDPTTTTMVENTTLGGTLEVPPDTAKNEDGTNFTGELSLSEVPGSLAPAALPEELDPGMLVTIQPVGVDFAQPAPLTLPNTDGLPPGSEMDLWSLDPDSGEFKIVGVGRVSADGSVIETISGGVQSATWHAFLPPFLDFLDFLKDLLDKLLCSDCNTGSDTSLTAGHLTVRHDLPRYLSLDQPRGLSLVYASETADPRPVLFTDVTVPVRAAVPDTLSVELEVGGSVQGSEVFTATTGLSESQDETVRQAVQLDGRNLPTGAYPYELMLRSNYATSSIGSTQLGETLIHNRRSSPVGAGWGIAGLERLIEEGDGDVVLTRGDGSIARYRPAATFFWDFEEPVGPEWSTTATAVTPNGGRRFLGEFSNHTVGLTLNSLPAHTAVELSFDLFVGRSWDGNSTSFGPDVWRVEAFDPAAAGFVPLLQTTFTTFPGSLQAYPDSYPGGSHPGTTGAVEVNTLGYTWSGAPRDSVYRITFSIPHTASSFQARWLSTVLQGVSDELWGLDNVGVDLIGVTGGDTTEFVSPDGDFSTLTGNPDGTFTRTLRDGTRVEYDASGLQTAVVDTNGNTTAFSYDASGRLIAITDPVGEVTTLVYSGGHLATITDPAGRVTTLTHDGAGDLASIQDADGTTRSFSYDAEHRLVSQTDKRGFVTTYEYDFAGRNVRTVRADGTDRQVLPFNRGGLVDPSSGEGTRSNPAPPVRPSDSEAVFIDGTGDATRYQTDGFGAATRSVDPLGRVSTVTRDGDGKPVRIVNPGGTVTELTWDSQGNLLSVREAVGSPVQRQASFTYEPVHNRLASVTDAAGGVASMTHDTAGNPTTVTDPLGGQYTLTYDARGQVLTSTDPLGRVTSFTYDARGNLATVTDPAGVVTAMTRDAAGNVVAITEAQGLPEERTRFFTYDALDRPLTVTDPTGAVSAFAYDTGGNLVQTVAPTGETTTRQLDSMGRLVLLDNPATGPLTFTYDGDGNLLTTRDVLGRVKAIAYDAADRPVTVTDPLGGVQRRTYDAEDNLLSFENASGRVTTFVYDALRRVTRRTDPLGRAEALTWDALDRLVSVTDAKGQTVSHTYDALSRRLSTSLPGDQLTFTYDAAGNLLSATDGDSAQSYTYDALDRLTSSASTDLGFEPALTLSFTYDVFGNRTQRTDSVGGTVDYGYDAAGRLVTLTTGAGITSLSWDASSRLTSLALPNGITADYTFGSRGLLTDLVYRDAQGAVVSSFSYTHDAVGQIASITEGTRLTPLDYDPLQRLVSAGPAGRPESYTYDANGNRTSSHLSTTQVHDAADQLLEDDAFRYTYDANGNLATREDKATGEVTTYNWDGLDRLVGISFPDGTSASYRYDALGRRVEKTVAGQTTRFAHDGSDLMLAYDGTGTVTSRFVHRGLDLPVSVETGGQVGFYLGDHEGSIRFVTDAAGTAVNQYEYDAFGNTVVAQETLANPFTFTGRELDAESGFYHYRNRTYDPGVGRFISRDPLGLVAGANAFTYVGNDPVNRTDPLGLIDPLTALDAASAAASAAAFLNCPSLGNAFWLGFDALALMTPLPSKLGLRFLDDLLSGLGKGLSKLKNGLRGLRGLDRGADALSAGNNLRRFVRQDEFRRIQQAIDSGTDVQLGRYFTPDNIVDARVATSQLALPGTGSNPVVGFVDVPVSALPSEPLSRFGPRITQPFRGRDLVGLPGGGLEVVFVSPPVVPGNVVRLVPLP